MCGLLFWHVARLQDPLPLVRRPDGPGGARPGARRRRAPGRPRGVDREPARDAGGRARRDLGPLAVACLALEPGLLRPPGRRRPARRAGRLVRHHAPLHARPVPAHPRGGADRDAGRARRRSPTRCSSTGGRCSRSRCRSCRSRSSRSSSRCPTRCCAASSSWGSRWRSWRSQATGRGRERRRAPQAVLVGGAGGRAGRRSAARRPGRRARRLPSLARLAPDRQRVARERAVRLGPELHRADLARQGHGGHARRVAGAVVLASGGARDVRRPALERVAPARHVGGGGRRHGVRLAASEPARRPRVHGADPDRGPRRAPPGVRRPADQLRRTELRGHGAGHAGRRRADDERARAGSALRGAGRGRRPGACRAALGRDGLPDRRRARRTSRRTSTAIPAFGTPGRDTAVDGVLRITDGSHRLARLVGRLPRGRRRHGRCRDAVRRRGCAWSRTSATRATSSTTSTRRSRPSTARRWPTGSRTCARATVRCSRARWPSSCASTASPPGSPRASPRGRTTRTTTSTASPTTTPTPGSRSTSRATAGCRSTRRPRARSTPSRRRSSPRFDPPRLLAAAARPNPRQSSHNHDDPFPHALAGAGPDRLAAAPRARPPAPAHAARAARHRRSARAAARRQARAVLVAYRAVTRGGARRPAVPTSPRTRWTRAWRSGRG